MCAPQTVVIMTGWATPSMMSIEMTTFLVKLHHQRKRDKETLDYMYGCGCRRQQCSFGMYVCIDHKVQTVTSMKRARRRMLKMEIDRKKMFSQVELSISMTICSEFKLLWCQSDDAFVVDQMKRLWRYLACLSFVFSHNQHGSITIYINRRDLQYGLL